MTSDHVGIGIVGSGFIAGAHAEAFARLPRATVRAVASRSAGRAAEFARRWGIPAWLTDFRELADRPEVDMVCIAALLRNSFRYASCRDWDKIAKDLRPVYTAASEAEALERFAEFAGTWEKRYPAIIKLWENAWPEFTPFLAFDREIRTLITTTNAIESLNARFRRSVKARGHFATEQAALKHLYLVVISLDPTGQGRQRWSNRWKAALTAFDIT
jgi:transposase-like protein